MKKIVGYLKNLVGRYYAKDAEGHLRELHPGDPVYEGEIVVNADGLFIPDALKKTGEDEPEQSGKETDIQTDLSDDEDQKDKKSDDSDRDNARPTTSTDEFDDNYAEKNINAPLEGEVDETGLLRETDEFEVDINAPVYSDRFSSGFFFPDAGMGNDHQGDEAGATGSGGEERPRIFVDSIAAEEGEYEIFTVGIDRVSSQNIDVDLSTVAGSADVTDYDAANMQVSLDGGATWITTSSATIAAGQTSVLVRVPTIEDTSREENETFTLTATVISGNTINSNAVGTATILDDDNSAPVVTAPLSDRSDNDSDVVSLDVSGNFDDVDGDILSYSASGLPAGLSIDPNTGVISGTIDHSASQSGPYSVTVTVDDGHGGTVSDTFTWTVANPAPTATDRQPERDRLCGRYRRRRHQRVLRCRRYGDDCGGGNAADQQRRKLHLYAGGRLQRHRTHGHLYPQRWRRRQRHGGSGHHRQRRHRSHQRRR